MSKRTGAMLVRIYGSEEADSPPDTLIGEVETIYYSGRAVTERRFGDGEVATIAARRLLSVAKSDRATEQGGRTSSGGSLLRAAVTGAFWGTLFGRLDQMGDQMAEAQSEIDDGMEPHFEGDGDLPLDMDVL